MFVNETALLITSETKLKFVAVNNIPSQTEYNISKSLNKVIKLYGQRVFLNTCDNGGNVFK